MPALPENFAAVFDKVFSVPTASVERRVRRDVLADEYPDGLDTYSYISRTELAEFAESIADADAPDPDVHHAMLHGDWRAGYVRVDRSEFRSRSLSCSAQDPVRPRRIAALPERCTFPHSNDRSRVVGDATRRVMDRRFPEWNTW